MLTVKVSTAAPDWPWIRQTPGRSGRWGPFRFVVDEPVSRCGAWVVFEALLQEETVLCPPGATVFVTGEPDSIGSYHPDFLAQFHTVVSGRTDLKHRNQLHLPQAHPWFVEKDFDELTTMPRPTKTKELCVITSDKAFTDGHRRRLDLAWGLQEQLGSRLQVYGRGIREFSSKWDLLSAYRYVIVIENYEGPDFITEKLPDAWLAFCYPFYIGSSNVDRYFPSDAYLKLDSEDLTSCVRQISNVLEDSNFYGSVMPIVDNARRYYLYNAQFFPWIANVLHSVPEVGSRSLVPVTLRPNSYFANRQVSTVERLFSTIIEYFK